MKLSPNFYVFIYEIGDILNVAEQDHDYEFDKATAPARRPPESYTGAACRTASAPYFGRAVASGPSATGLF